MHTLSHFFRSSLAPTEEFTFFLSLHLLRAPPLPCRIVLRLVGVCSISIVFAGPIKLHGKDDIVQFPFSSKVRLTLSHWILLCTYLLSCHNHQNTSSPAAVTFMTMKIECCCVSTKAQKGASLVVVVGLCCLFLLNKDYHNK